MDELIVFNPLYQDDEIESCFNMYNELINGNLKNSNKFVSLLIKLAEKYNLYDNLFNSLLTYLLINNENSFTLALERKKPISSNLKAVVMNDFKTVKKLSKEQSDLKEIVAFHSLLHDCKHRFHSFVHRFHSLLHH